MQFFCTPLFAMKDVAGVKRKEEIRNFCFSSPAPSPTHIIYHSKISVHAQEGICYFDESQIYLGFECIIYCYKSIVSKIYI